MNWTTFGIGVLALLLGFYTIYARFKDPSKLKKLEPMRQAFGQRAGTIVHVVSYTIIPIIFGVLMIISGMKGLNTFGE